MKRNIFKYQFLVYIMVLPKVRFKLPTITDETTILSTVIKPKNIGNSLDYSRYVYHEHPSLKSELERTNEDNYKDTIKRYVRFVRGKHYESLKGILNRYQREWNKINDKYMKTLEEIMDIKWPKKRLNISAYVSINPISTSSFDDRSFSIYYKKSLNEIKSLVAHEIFEFLLYMKWKKLFKRASEKDFEPPNLEWHLTEILTTAIINNDIRIQKIIKVREKGYLQHERIKIGGKNAIEHFTDMYNKHLSNKTSFDKFLKSSYKEIKKYKALFKN